MDIASVFGMIGAILFIVAIWRTSVKKWNGKSVWYELDIFSAAIFLSIYAYTKGAYIVVLINVVWIYVAFRGLISYAERRLGRTRNRRF